MVGKSVVDEEAPDIETVVGALNDEDCRTLIETLDEPRTASDLLERCDIPRSTLYRKLEQLTDATLVQEGTEVRMDGSHATRYELDFDDVVVMRNDETELEVHIDRPAQRADERLADMWSEVRREL